MRVQIFLGGRQKKSALKRPCRASGAFYTAILNIITKIARKVNSGSLAPSLGREIKDLTKRKKGADILAATYEKTSLADRAKKAFALRTCGKKVIYAENPAGGAPILVSAIRCSLRLCPSCSWTRARKIFENVHAVITHRDFSDKQFIFLTLTLKNCSGVFLNDEIFRLFSAWRKLTGYGRTRPGFARSFAGTFRALEVTYNPREKTFHPHLHVLAAVENDYFRKTNKDYIDQPRLRELWRDACGLDYLPQCRIEKVRNTTRKQVAEVAKYTVKSADYLDRPAVVEVLDKALKGKRLISYGGLFKTVRSLLDLPDEDELPESEFHPIATEELLLNPYIRKIMLEWKMGSYKVTTIPASNDPADWLAPGRLIAKALSDSAKG